MLANRVCYLTRTIIEISLTFVPVLPVIIKESSSRKALLLSCLVRNPSYFCLFDEIKGNTLDVITAPAFFELPSIPSVPKQQIDMSIFFLCLKLIPELSAAS